MATRRIADGLPAAAIVDGMRGSHDMPHGAIVPDSPEYMWVAIRDALRRRQERACAQHPVCVEPADFAAAMRQVEDEVYNAD